MLAATEPSGWADHALPDLDLDANELALVYRTRGLPEADALERARQVVAAAQAADRAEPYRQPVEIESRSDHDDVVGSDFGAAISSFLFFSSGAIIPVLPWLFGLQGLTAVLTALVLVGIALMGTGAMVGLLSGGPPLRRAFRQLLIGYGAAAITYLLGLAFGVSMG